MTSLDSESLRNLNLSSNDNAIDNVTNNACLETYGSCATEISERCPYDWQRYNEILGHLNVEVVDGDGATSIECRA